MDFMLQAVKEAFFGIRHNHGGPFGAIIVRNGKIIASAHNTVIKTNDPTAHAEVNAVRKAAKKLKRFDLSDCVIYTNCEPCPMCLGAVYWAHLDKMYYGNTKTDAKNIGFDDSFIYDEIELKLSKRRLKSIQKLPEEAIKAFKAWANSSDKIEY